MTGHLLLVTFALLTTEALGLYQDTNETIEYRVAILLDGGISCGGTILDDQHILTAAYCVLEPSGKVYPSTIQVMRDKNDTPMVAEMIYVPRQINKTCQMYEPVENIAIIKLHEKIGLDKHPILKKINLPEPLDADDDEEYEEKPLVVAGYGVTEIDVNVTANGEISNATKVTHPKYLQLVKAVLVPRGKCDEYWDIISPIQPTEMCAKIHVEKYHGLCRADFGNGLIYNNTVIGVLISSNALCYEDIDEYSLPAVYTKVTPYVEFIQKVLSNSKELLGNFDEYVCSFKANDAQNSHDRELISLVWLSVIVGLVRIF